MYLNAPAPLQGKRDETRLCDGSGFFLGRPQEGESAFSQARCSTTRPPVRWIPKRRGPMPKPLRLPYGRHRDAAHREGETCFATEPTSRLAPTSAERRCGRCCAAGVLRAPHRCPPRWRGARQHLQLVPGPSCRRTVPSPQWPAMPRKAGLAMVHHHRRSGYAKASRAAKTSAPYTRSSLIACPYALSRAQQHCRSAMEGVWIDGTLLRLASTLQHMSLPTAPLSGLVCSGRHRDPLDMARDEEPYLVPARQ